MTSRLRRMGPAVVLAGASAALFWAGCGEDDTRQPPPLQGTDGPSSGDAPADSAQNIDSSTGEAGGTVSVTIVSPSRGATVTGGSFQVNAQVVSTGAAIDTTQVRAQLGSLPEVRLFAAGPTTFTGFVSFGDLVSGSHDLVVRAATLDGANAQEAEPVVLNAGPIITILRPARDEPMVSTLVYDFQVRIASALSAHIGSVAATIGQCVVPALAAPNSGTTAQEWNGTVDLTMCSPRLNEGRFQFTVTATDDGNPPVSAQATVPFVIDRTGPDILVTEPAAGELVGGIITVSATVTDPSGINAASVAATVSHGGTGFTFPLQDQGTGTFSSTFDTRLLPNPTIIQYPAVEVVADDTLGNHSTTGGILFTLDNVPPVGDLDPPVNMRVVRFPGSILPGQCDPSLCTCSRLFRPNGDDSPRDGAVVPQVFDLRAEILDDGNHAVGADRVFISGVQSATLYVLGDAANVGKPLVLDTDGDGICDSINPAVIPIPGMPVAGRAVELSMVQIPPAGSASFEGLYAVPSICTAGGAADAPNTLCSTTPMTFSFGYSEANLPAIWTLPPVQTGVDCTGLQFDALANHVPDGWMCVAVAFVDGTGNHSVSAPLRLCENHTGGATCSGGAARPDCTNTLDMNGTLTGTPCSARRSDFDLLYVRQ